MQEEQNRPNRISLAVITYLSPPVFYRPHPRHCIAQHCTALHSIVSQYMEEIGDFDQNFDISTSISRDMHLHISQAVSLTLPIQTYVFVKSLTVASSPTSTTLPTSPTSLGKCFIKNCTPVVISFPPQAPAIQCLVQLALCNCNRRTGRLHQILSLHCLCQLVNCSRLSNEYIHQTSQQYETQQLGDLSNAPI